MLANTINHLTEQEVAMCAEAVMDKRFNTLPAALKEHLEQCDQCSAEVAMVADIELLDTEELRPAGNSVSFNRWIVPLLAAAVLLGFVLWVLIPSQPSGNGDGAMLAVEQKAQDKELSEQEEESSPDDMGITANASDSAAETEPTPVVAADAVQPDIVEPEKEQDVEASPTLLASFTPDPDMEMLVDNFGSAYRGGEIQVKTPSLITRAEYSKLEWSNPGNATVRVQITDNQGNEVFTVATSSTSADIPEMQPGLYYWRLIEEEDFDLLFAGKILWEAKD